ncbi:hypothetical protein O6H91_05G015100 [Diphasiastrum complanatum]|uniref:Uncharacterized protein n=1 Tax=Diphasiastrum complanatum TaxID=34168 RepID=A0ACC2DKU8_DIPCM|nr:hypothetical protein O6H91_05G015100 [Diphasiastrum complanatum]
MALDDTQYKEESAIAPLSSSVENISEIKIPVDANSNANGGLNCHWNSALQKNNADVMNGSRCVQAAESGQFSGVGFDVNLGRAGQSGWDRQSHAELRPGFDSQESLRPLDPHLLASEPDCVFHHRASTEVVPDEEFEREFGTSNCVLGSKDGMYRRVNSSKSEKAFIVRQGAESDQELDTNSNNQNISDSTEDFKIETMLLTGGSGVSPVLKTVIRTLFFVLVWYIFHTSLILYNKLLLGAEWGRFPAPLLSNTIHFAMQAFMSTLMLRFCCPPLLPTVSMSWKDYFVRVVPIALATALDVDLLTASIVSITVTFSTMCRSGAPVFLLIFAFAFKLETPSFKLSGIIFIISMGVLLAVARDTEFKLLGFIFIMLANVMSGFRWVAIQVLLQVGLSCCLLLYMATGLRSYNNLQMLLEKEEYGLSNPFAAMNCVAPVMTVVTALFSLIFEPWHKLRATAYFDTPHHFFSSCLLMLFGGALAFFMVAAEYLLVSETSAVTFTVAGVAKEVVTIIVAIFFFGDHFTVQTALGLVIIIIGLSLFNWFKYKKLVERNLDNYADTRAGNSQDVFKYTILEEGDDAEEAKLLIVHNL